MNFSITKLVSSLIDIIMESPSSFLFIVLGIIFSIAMIINMKKNKTIGKTLFLGGWVFIISFIIVKYNNFVSKILDNLINNIFMQIFFPNLASYTIIIIVTNVIFIRSILNKKSKTSNKIINSLFFIAIMVLMVFTIEVIAKNDINIYVRKQVYSNDSVITLIESTTLLFVLWMFILLSKSMLSKLIKKGSEKIQEEFEKKNNKVQDSSNAKQEKTVNTTTTPISPVTEPVQEFSTVPVSPVAEPVSSTEPVTSPVVSPFDNIEPLSVPVNEDVVTNPVESIEPIKIIEPVSIINSTSDVSTNNTSDNPFEQFKMIPSEDTGAIKVNNSENVTLASVEPELNLEKYFTGAELLNIFKEEPIEPQTIFNSNIENKSSTDIFNSIPDEDEDIEVFKM